MTGGGAEPVVTIVDRHARRNPDALALVAESERLTFAELAQRSARIAAAIVSHGLQPESRVALHLPSGSDMVAAMIGALRAGVAFVPLNIDAPVERRSDIIQRARVELVITGADDPTEAESCARGIRQWSIDHPAPDRLLQPVRARPGNLAYVIYTSGSTGEPKGVMIERRSLAAMLAAHDALGVRPNDRYLVFAPPYFDGFLVDVLVPLSVGACAVICPRTELIPGADLARTLVEQRITFATLPPAALAVLPDRPYPDLRAILTAGDHISGELAARWIGRVEAFYNSYGATETTVAATLGRYHRGETDPHVGTPLPGVSAHVLHDAGCILDDGHVGELHVAGWGVARGYLDDPVRTAERFVPDPYGPPGTRLYRSGDLASRRADGQLRIHGRRDRELKVRGVRIHPAEIEAVLTDVDGVSQAAVVATGEGADARLVGFVALAADRADIDDACLVSRVRSRLELTLPAEYRLQEIRCVTSLPVGPTGKVDTGRLAELAADERVGSTGTAGRAEEGPDRSLTRQFIATVWGDVLGVSVDPDTTASFFELGGHSLQAARMLRHLESEFGSVVRYADFFRNSTIPGVVALMNGSNAHVESGHHN